ncbi:hypothetical protein Taro_017308 [Colocasia esculenta]|uniref:Transmembrane protein n=1 Tax=Colocasia esculenta TaxID=4460 RepID=A0A843UQV7_COLES|nr:hypothetical protein [Colocasia esculenta]
MPSNFCTVSRRALVCESSHSLCGLSRRAQFGVVVLRLLFEPSCSVFGVVALQGSVPCVQCEAALGVLLFSLLVQASFWCMFLLCLGCAWEALVVVGRVALPTCGGLLWRVLPVSRVVLAVGATVLHSAEFWCLWWHPLLVLE